MEKNNIKNRPNIAHIILNYEKIYIAKLFVFIIVALTVRIIVTDENTLSEISIKSFIGIFTFLLTTTIDCLVLVKTASTVVKGKINTIHVFYFVIIFACSSVIVCLFLGIINISSNLIAFANVSSFLCCISPILEFFYDLIIHIELEEKNHY